MRRVEMRYAEQEPDGEDRFLRLIALLSTGLERLLKKRRGAAVDFSPDLSVTTDYEKEEP